MFAEILNSQAGSPAAAGGRWSSGLHSIMFQTGHLYTDTATSHRASKQQVWKTADMRPGQVGALESGIYPGYQAFLLFFVLPQKTYGGRSLHGECFMASALNCNLCTVTVLPSRCENGVEAVPDTPHSCLTNLYPTHCCQASTYLPQTQVIYLYPPMSILYCLKLYIIIVVPSSTLWDGMRSTILSRTLAHTLHKFMK